MIDRIIKLTKSNSFFLFGNRGVGKSTLLQLLYPTKSAIWYNLLDPKIEKRLALDPGLLDSELNEARKKYKKNTVVVIDEIQKIPALLDVIHMQIEKKHFQFVLTGSSARKLKKQAANLLAGRAFIYNLYPFSFVELQEILNYQKFCVGEVYLRFLNSVKNADKIDFLNSYTDTYLREEIVSEQLVRNIIPFRHFLEVAAQSNAKIVNYKNIADSIGVEISTVQNYFQILEDTFVGVLLQPFHESIRERQRKNPKFYYFDTGVARALQNRLTLDLIPQSYEYGDLFEQFIVLGIYSTQFIL